MRALVSLPLLSAQAGVEVGLPDSMLLSFDVLWTWLRTPPESLGTSLAEQTITPILLGAGVGFRF